MCSGEVLDSPDPQLPQAEVLPADVQDPVVPETTETAMDTKPESPTDDDARTGRHYSSPNSLPQDFMVK